MARLERVHGYPYDVRAFDEVVAILSSSGLRTIVPYIRGYGPTRFLSPETQRSGEQAAIAQHRYEIGRLLWQLWSPTWKFDEENYRRTAESFVKTTSSMWSHIPIGTA
jgi:hypothetical protein